MSACKGCGRTLKRENKKSGKQECNSCGFTFYSNTIHTICKKCNEPIKKVIKKRVKRIVKKKENGVE